MYLSNMTFSKWLFVYFSLLSGLSQFVHGADTKVQSSQKEKIYIIPIREDIMPPLTYLVRRGVKEAIASKAECLILDMDTNGGRVDVTQEIIQIITKFKGRKVTYINSKAFSAGAFISVATNEIYMSPVSVIGAAAPIMVSPGGGASEMPNTMEVKMTSGISALIRATAEENGHDPAVVEAMIDKSKELKKGDKILSEKGQILTLTNKEAEITYGDPPKKLMSHGTVNSQAELIEVLGYANPEVIRITPTGAEKAGTWINKISAILLIAGILGVYLEFKTPGFGLPGILGLVAFAVYFLGGYIAGLSGLEWAAFFVIGLFLLIVELFLLPGLFVIGLSGILLMLWSVLMGLVDMDPSLPVWQLPSYGQFKYPLQVLLTAITGSTLLMIILSSVLPKTQLFHQLISEATSGDQGILSREKREKELLGLTGVTLSPLRPGGKARFGDTILDVVTNGTMVAAGAKVRVIGFSTSDAVVEQINY